MWGAFYWENIKFAVDLLAALTWLAVGWLYADAWVVRRRIMSLPILAGLFLLAVSFAVDAVTVETEALMSSLNGWQLNGWLEMILRLAGYFLIIVSLMFQRLEKKPATGPVFAVREKPASEPGSVDNTPPTPGFTFSAVALPTMACTALRPILALFISILYFRRYMAGLERHLRPLAWSFLLLAFYELSRVAWLARGTVHPVLYQAVQPYGVVWIVAHLFLLLAVIIAARWVTKYLLKRLQTQLFMIFVLMTVLIFLITTLTFTALLLRNVEQAALGRLDADRAVLEYALSSKKAEILSDAQLLAADAGVQEATAGGDILALRGLLQTFWQQKKTSMLVVVDVNGRVIARGEDPERVGDSLSDDPVIKRALQNEAVATTAAHEGALAPVVSIRGAVPIARDGKTIGALMTGTVLDNSFLTGLKLATGLEVAIYGRNILSATTLVGLEGNYLSGIGTKLIPPELAGAILDEGKTRLDSLSYLGIPYLVSFSPLYGLDKVAAGILFIGAPEQEIMKTASSSIQLTFMVTMALIAAAIAPAYWLAGRLARQLH